jgi:hypothetical protein
VPAVSTLSSVAHLEEPEPRRLGRLVATGFLAHVETGVVGRRRDTGGHAEREAVLGVPSSPLPFQRLRFPRREPGADELGGFGPIIAFIF